MANAQKHKLWSNYDELTSTASAVTVTDKVKDKTRQ